MTAPREHFTMWVRWQAKPQWNHRMEVGCLDNQHLIGGWSFNFHLCLFPAPIPQGEVRVWKVNPSQMPKDLMNCDLSWSFHRNLNRARYSWYSKELRSIQAKIWVYSIMAHSGQCSSLHRGLCLCPSPSKDHSPHGSCKNPVSKWVLSHRPHDESLIDWESDSDF